MAKKTILIIVLLLFAATGISADTKKFVLYGFKIGQNKNTALQQLGTPFKSHVFPDGFSYVAFKMKDHIVVIQSDNTKPDLIWAIQIQGKSNPPFHGIGPVNLGDPLSKVYKTFGNPDRVKTATDEETKKLMKGIRFHSYDKSRNFSIETRNNIVTSIKISFNGPEADKEETVSIKDFIKTVKSKNLNRISRYISADFIYYSKKPQRINRSIISSLSENKEINDIFFNREYGIISIKKNDIVDAALRIETDPGMSGFVYKIKRKNMTYELFFVESYEGHVLRYINIKGK